jgi:hypothetical protein
LTLRLERARTTKDSGKTIATVAVLRNGAAIDHLQVPDSVTGRREIATRLARLVHQDDADTRCAADCVLGQILADAAALGSTAPIGPGLHALVSDYVRRQFNFTSRGKDGYVSSTRGLVRRQDFFADAVTSDLLQLASLAISAENRTTMVRKIKTELEVVWGDYSQSLPTAADINLVRDGPDANAFWGSILHMWVSPQTWEIDQHGHAAKASLIGRVWEDMQTSKKKPPNRWHPVLGVSIPARWRHQVTGEGELRRFLAMRGELLFGFRGVTLPGVDPSDKRLHEAFVRQGIACGAVDPNPPFRQRPVIWDGQKQHRVAVLSRELTDQIFQVFEASSEDY